MNKPNLTKLSITVLADSFSAQEARNGVVFVVFGHGPELDLVADFLRLLGRDGQTLFGAAFVESKQVPSLTLLLGVRRSGRYTQVEDFQTALRYDCSKEPSPGSEVWGALLRLS